MDTKTYPPFFPDSLKKGEPTNEQMESIQRADAICILLEELSQKPENPDLTKLIGLCNIDHKSRGAAITVRSHLQQVMVDLTGAVGVEAVEVEQKYGFALGAMFIATSQPFKK